jgi:transcriptional regulator GlxA family with amidase domain
MSPRHLTRLFQRELGTAPARYVERLRLEAAQLLLEAGHSIGSAAARSGFGSEETLRRAFLHHLGLPLATCRRRFASTAPAIRPRPENLTHAATRIPV